MNDNEMKRVYEKHDTDKEEIRRSIVARINAEQGPKKSGMRLRPILAVCLSLLLMAGCFSGFAIAVEAKEYREAVDFFNEYSLSTEGLTRSEIKAVYKDILMKTYSYEKTIEILNNFSIEMYSTGLGSIDRDSLEAMWNTRNHNIFGGGDSQDHSSIWYSVEYTDPSLLNKDEIPVDEATIIKHDQEAEVWRYTVPYDMYVFIGENVIVSDDGIIVFGSKDNSGSGTGNAVAFMLDNDGNLLWEYTDKKAGSDFEAAVLSNDELALFGQIVTGDRYSRIFTVLDQNGTVLKYLVSETERYARYDIAIKVGGHYLVKQYVRKSGYTMEPELISISADGKEIGSFTYLDCGEIYQVQDIAYHNGKVYLSALLPNISESVFGERFSKLSEEYYKRWNKASENYNDIDNIEMPEDYNAQLQSLFSEAYTAVLLVCDENAVISKAYSVENARAGKLTTDDNENLSWQVMRIDDVKNACPYISSRRVDILATEFSFVFDDAGKLDEKNEIGVYPMMY